MHKMQPLVSDHVCEKNTVIDIDQSLRVKLSPCMFVFRDDPSNYCHSDIYTDGVISVDMTVLRLDI